MLAPPDSCYQDDRAPVILAEVYGSGARFARAEQGSLLLDSVWETDSKDQTTFTGAIQVFSQRCGIDLRGCTVAISAAGAVTTDTIRITNGNWFVSRSGLAAITGAKVHVVNYVAAVGWAMSDLPSRALRSIGSGAAPTGARPQAVLWLGEGVGAAALVRAGGRVEQVMDSEAGHCTFSPTSTTEWEVADAVRRRHGHCSIERVLTLDPSGISTWNSFPNVDLEAVKLGALASLSRNLILTYAAWDGLFLAGPGAARMLEGSKAEAFRTLFSAKDRLQRLLDTTPIWLVSDRYLALRGALAAFRRA